MPESPADRHARLTELVGAACELPPDARPGHVAAACADDPALAAEALALLAEASGLDLASPLVRLRTEPTAGRVLAGRYALVDVLGRGAQGTVFAADDLRLGKRLAVKQMLGHDALALRLFEREAQLLGRLRGAAPGRLAAMLPNVTDLFVADDCLYFAMDLVPGATLAELGERGPLAPADVVEIGERLLELLEFLHAQRPEPVVHRDLKPENLQRTPDGGLVLLDFGLTTGAIARLSRLGRGGASVGPLGTPQYAPWEQIVDGQADPRSDVFAAGATLYRLLTGDRFPDVFARTAALADGAPDPLLAADVRRPGVPAPLAQVLARAMRLRPAERPQSAAEFRALWRAAADAPPPSTPTRWTALGVAQAIGAALLAAALVLGATRAPAGPRLAALALLVAGVTLARHAWTRSPARALARLAVLAATLLVAALPRLPVRGRLLGPGWWQLVTAPSVTAGLLLAGSAALALLFALEALVTDPPPKHEPPGPGTAL